MEGYLQKQGGTTAEWDNLLGHSSLIRIETRYKRSSRCEN